MFFYETEGFPIIVDFQHAYRNEKKKQKWKSIFLCFIRLYIKWKQKNKNIFWRFLCKYVRNFETFILMKFLHFLKPDACSDDGCATNHHLNTLYDSKKKMTFFSMVFKQKMFIVLFEKVTFLLFFYVFFLHDFEHFFKIRSYFCMYFHITNVYSLFWCHCAVLSV